MSALSSEQIRTMREELSSGATPTVWFTGSAVGVESGKSGKVVSLDEPEEGDFIQVRPAGSKDVLSFSAAEVTTEKPPRKRKEPQPTKDAPTARSSSASAGATKASAGASTVHDSAANSAPRASAPSSAQSKTPEPAGKDKQQKSRARSDAESATARSAERSTVNRATASQRSSARRPTGATITLTANAEGAWSVEVNNGKKRVLRPTSVAASAVAQAAKALHEDVAQAVEPLLEAEREHQRARVEELQRELEQAQQRLSDLSD